MTHVYGYVQCHLIKSRHFRLMTYSLDMKVWKTDLGKLHINQDAVFGVNCIDKFARATRYQLLLNPGPD